VAHLAIDFAKNKSKVVYLHINHGLKAAKVEEYLNLKTGVVKL